MLSRLPDRPARIEFLRFESTGDTWSRLLAKDVDLATSVPWNKFEIFRTVPSIRRVSSLSRAEYLLDLHDASPPFDRVDVRRALSLAVDRAAFVHGVAREHGPTSPWAACMAGVRRVRPVPLEPDPYDPQGALRLLAGAGIAGRRRRPPALERARRCLRAHRVRHRRRRRGGGSRCCSKTAAHGHRARRRSRRRHTARLRRRAAPFRADVAPHHPSRRAGDLLHDPDAARFVDPAAAPATDEARRQALRALQRRFRDEPPSIYLYWIERLAIIDSAYCGLPRLPDGPESALHLVHLCAPGEAE